MTDATHSEPEFTELTPAPFRRLTAHTRHGDIQLTEEAWSWVARIPLPDGTTAAVDLAFEQAALRFTSALHHSSTPPTDLQQLRATAETMSSIVRAERRQAHITNQHPPEESR
ncbi:hypothetical protein RCO28_20690 [Streptomyces sp. LHD-70]|uniref:hypothetical protein n=1 Tax=Streptomyces sp. LHD-70 TaxID=3072140 RepID=UPI00280D4C36|nr:hypothetical protein [Streptomyces sp. LHD-70]MDQ8704891.1 hypothetical protein [Streptomyces sp. LHD-70]